MRLMARGVCAFCIFVVPINHHSKIKNCKTNFDHSPQIKHNPDIHLNQIYITFLNTQDLSRNIVLIGPGV